MIGRTNVAAGSGNGVMTVDLPTRLSSLSATAGNKTVTLKLSYSYTSYVSGVQVNYKTGSYPTSPTDGTSKIATGAATSIQITSLTNSTTYYFRVFLYREIDGIKYFQTDIVNARTTGMPSATTPLSDKAVGDIVKIKVNGTAKDFIIVHQGLPSSMYDSSCNGTWLLMKDIYTEMKWDSSNNDYQNSDIHAYLNGTFYNLFDSDIKTAIKQVKIPYCSGEGDSCSVLTNAKGLSCKVFLLSCYEVGTVNTTVTPYFPDDGACLSYFSGLAAKDSKRIAYLNGSAAEWWLRSPYTFDASSACRIGKDGNNGAPECSTIQGARPAFVLPYTLRVDENGNVIT